MVYKGTCKICEEQNITASYFKESGFSGYYRSQIHKKEIIEKDLENAFAKHLQIFHPDQEGNPDVFKITVIQTFRKPLPRQNTEAVFIFNNNADIKMNSKTEFRQPAIPRITTTREPSPGEGAGGGRGGGRGQGKGGEGPDNRAESFLSCVFQC